MEADLQEELEHHRAYWISMGLRAAAFVPAELPASWVFHVSAPQQTTPWRADVRASLVAFVIPRALVVSLLLAPLLGWRLTIQNAVILCAAIAILEQLVALSIGHVPFTEEYRPGYANLKVWWRHTLLVWRSSRTGRPPYLPSAEASSPSHGGVRAAVDCRVQRTRDCRPPERQEQRWLVGAGRR